MIMKRGSDRKSLHGEKEYEFAGAVFDREKTMLEDCQGSSGRCGESTSLVWDVSLVYTPVVVRLPL